MREGPGHTNSLLGASPGELCFLEALKPQKGGGHPS